MGSRAPSATLSEPAKLQACDSDTQYSSDKRVAFGGLSVFGWEEVAVHDGFTFEGLGWG